MLYGRALYTSSVLIGAYWISIIGLLTPTYWLLYQFSGRLAGIWALITSSRINGDKPPILEKSMVQWSVKWLVPSFVATPFLLVWCLFMVPQSQRALLTLAIDTIAGGTFSAVTRIALIIIVTSATIVGVAYYLAFRNPMDFNLSHAMSVLLLALIVTGAGEYAREMLRKPYVIGRWMYSNGTRVTYVNRMNTEGYLAHSNWSGAEETRNRQATHEAKRSSRGMRVLPHALWLSVC